MAFKSGFERSIDANLKMRKVKFEYEGLKISYILEGVYNPDFIFPNGVIVEAKGILNKYDRYETRKMIAVKKQHPELDVRLLFMDASRKVPGTKQTHGEWATRNGFLFAEREVPDSWVT